MDEDESKSIRITKAVVLPIVTIAFSGAVIFFTYMKLLSSEAFLGIATTVILSWFREREKVRTETPPKPGPTAGGK